jgi:hypothetical protein
MNWNIPQSGNPNAIVLTAHPDDETIFCGGTMLYYPSWSWTVVCVTMQLGTPRPQEFQHAMDMYKSYGVNIISSLTLEQRDEGQELSTEEVQTWKTLINGSNQSPDIVFTHNQEGEYGHPHHKSLNRISHELFPNIWEFICPGAVNVAPQPFKDKNNVVPLSVDILNKKTEIFNRSYTTQLACWKALSEIMQFEFRTGPEIFTSS